MRGIINQSWVQVISVKLYPVLKKNCLKHQGPTRGNPGSLLFHPYQRFSKDFEKRDLQYICR